jgi:hypothetical protein
MQEQPTMIGLAGFVFVVAFIVLSLSGCGQDSKQSTPPSQAVTRTLTLSWAPYPVHDGLRGIRVYRGIGEVCSAPTDLSPLLIDAAPAEVFVVNGSIASEFTDVVDNEAGRTVCYELDAIDTDGLFSARSERASTTLG